MNPAWLHGGAPGYVHPYQGVAYADTNTASHYINNAPDFMPKAYINPYIVNYTGSLSNSGQVPNKIHVNPYFRGGSLNYFHQNSVTVREGNCVHVNPYFRRGEHIAESFPAIENPANDYIATIDTIEENDATNSNSQVNADIVGLASTSALSCENEVVHSEEAKTPFKSKQNSTYFWCKGNAVCDPKPKTECTVVDSVEMREKQDTANLTHAKSTKCLNLPEYQTKIKTRHKIVRKSNICHRNDAASDNNGYKFKLSNRYKVVNVKKSKGEPTLESACLTALKPKTLYSRTHFVNTSKAGNSAMIRDKEVEKQNYQLLKLKYSCVNRSVNIYKLPNSIKSKYKYINKSFLHKRKQVRLSHQENINYATNSHRMCVQNAKLKTILKHSYDIRKLFPKKVSLGKANARWSWNGSILKKNRFKSARHLMWRKQSEYEKDMKKIKKSYPNKTVVNIGGILYKSTTNKLTRTKEKKKVVSPSKEHYTICKFSSNRRALLRSGKRHHIIYVRGEKFLLDANGKTLVRKPSSLRREGASKYVAKRVDIGGVTYIQKSNNILIRTNTHQARHLLNQAKQKSIALLSNLRKRNNMPCMIYHKFGKCMQHSKGLCIYIHDPKNIAICKKFLKGECTDSHCLLSHNIIKEKIATCHFFLKGKCSRENCPFLHVKVNKKAAICKNFLQGFCSLGQNCNKRHIHQCPDFDDKGVCSRGNKCPYPHKTNSKKKIKGCKNVKATKFKLKKTEYDASESKDSNHSIKTAIDKEENLNQESLKCKESRSRIKSKISKRTERTSELKSEDINTETVIECIPKRIKLDDLPLFIPLNEK